MPNISKILNILLYVLMSLALGWLVFELFFGGFSGKIAPERKYLEEFSIVYPETPASFEPTLLVPSTRQVLVNVYEPLVKFDAALNPEPALAVHWGLIDDYTWEFELRPNVVFHDGSSLDVEDVIASVERARTMDASQVADFLTSIKDIEKIDAVNFRIVTAEPDPLLLQRLSLLFIVPSESDAGIASKPNGTGPYKFVNRGELLSFANYWGRKQNFEKVNLLYEADKSLRTSMLLNDRADFLAFVPYEARELVKNAGFVSAEVPTLELQFLIYNFKSPLFKDVEKRHEFDLLLDKQKLVDKLGSLAKPAEQFVSSGVFGFNPKLKGDSEFVSDLSLKGKTIKVSLPRGLEALGEYLRFSLQGAEVLPVISYLDNEALLKSIEQGKADVYFLAFKSDLGDAMDFFDQLVASDAEFNFFGYNNEIVDQLLDRASKEMDIGRRRDLLQNIMEIVVRDDPYGVPLFEYEVSYAFNSKLDYLSRIDGLIYFDDLIIK